MAETRKIILNSERKNLQGFAVPHKSLVLDYWLKNRNGQVTYNPLDGKHDGAVVIGRVPAESIRFEEIGGEIPAPPPAETATPGAEASAE